MCRYISNNQCKLLRAELQNFNLSLNWDTMLYLVESYAGPNVVNVK